MRGSREDERIQTAADPNEHGHAGERLHHHKRHRLFIKRQINHSGKVLVGENHQLQGLRYRLVLIANGAFNKKQKKSNKSEEMSFVVGAMRLF